MVSIKKQIQIWFLIIILILSFIASSPQYSIICSVMALILLFDTLTQRCRLAEKITFSSVYVMLYVVQLASYDIFNRSITNKTITTLLLFLSFCIGMYFNTRIENLEFNKFNEKNLSFSDLKLLKIDILEKINLIEESKKKINASTIQEIMQDLPRHSSFKYINNSSLTDSYFENAQQSMQEPYVYIVCSDTGSAASNLISLFTRKVYNHSSLSFDKDLKTLISYNGGEKVYPPGLNSETIEWFFKKKESSILVYRLQVSSEQKTKMIDIVKKINDEGSAYNMMGLITNTSFRPNILYCSQFVYFMLESVDAIYFNKRKNKIRPTDFIEYDYERKLEFVEKISL